ncbi:MAG: hypothetical protein FJ128_07560 [Deltaproteobacteria bacterium]|nr:hypothetical protein [Deltaproteobacteria bacterium]
MGEAEAQPETEPRRAGWFERHAKLTLFLVLLVALGGLALLADRLLALKIKPPQTGVTRHIRMRELPPGYAEVVILPPGVLEPGGGALPPRSQLRADAQGFIMPSRVHDRPDVTLAFLGGSTTECRHQPEEKRFAFLAGRLLEARTGLKVNSYNASRSGNNSLHSLNLLLNKVLPLKPTVVVMMHNVNDLTTLLYEGTYWNRNASRRPVVEERRSLRGDFRNLVAGLREATIPHLYAAIRSLGRKTQEFSAPDEFAGVRGRRLSVDEAFLLREFTANLTAFVHLCRARGVRPVLMTQANRLKAVPDDRIARQLKAVEAQGIPYAVYKGLYDRFNQTVREVAAREGAILVDLDRLIPQEKLYMFDAVHFTDQGSELVAQKVAEALQGELQR